MKRECERERGVRTCADISVAHGVYFLKVSFDEESQEILPRCIWVFLDSIRFFSKQRLFSLGNEFVTDPVYDLSCGSYLPGNGQRQGLYYRMFKERSDKEGGGIGHGRA